jgi:hypothetical protein
MCGLARRVDQDVLGLRSRWITPCSWAWWTPSAVSRSTGDLLAERIDLSFHHSSIEHALDQLHRDVAVAVEDARFVDADDVRMGRQLGRQLGLAEEALLVDAARVGIGLVLEDEHLERHAPVERRVERS